MSKAFVVRGQRVEGKWLVGGTGREGEEGREDEEEGEGGS